VPGSGGLLPRLVPAPDDQDDVPLAGRPHRVGRSDPDLRHRFLRHHPEAAAPRGWLAGHVPRLQPGDVACWVLKSAAGPDDVAPGWAPGSDRELDRCVRRSYRLDLVQPGQPCLLWVSGRRRPGVHAVGEVTGAVVEGERGPVVGVRLTRLAEPVERAELLADPAARDAEVLRMPAGSNPSWLSAPQYAAVVSRLGPRPIPLRRLHSAGWDDGSP
jgi:hypothetical protein